MRSDAPVLIQFDWCPYKKERLGHGKNHVRTQGEGSHLQVMEKGLRRTQCCQHCDLGFPAFRTMRNKFLLLKSPSLWYSAVASLRTNTDSRYGSYEKWENQWIFSSKCSQELGVLALDGLPGWPQKNIIHHSRQNPGIRREGRCWRGPKGELFTALSSELKIITIRNF